MHDLRDMALRVAKQEFLVILQPLEGHNIKLDGEATRLYTGKNLCTLIAGLCDEVLRLRDGLTAIAESGDEMQYKPHDYARMILDRTLTKPERGEQ